MAEVIEQPTVTVNNPLKKLGWIPLTVCLETVLERFSVQELLHLAPGSIVQGTIPAGAQIPVLVNGKLMAWAKLDVVGDHLAARITELL
ncbi:MAG: FliM/FliN family flagellar motor switch protein [Acidobacteria bacterium]|nr:FliM/FliN family flagellar motor switch protein [Acidobacteriota bacterium]